MGARWARANILNPRYFKICTGYPGSLSLDRAFARFRRYRSHRPTKGNSSQSEAPTGGDLTAIRQAATAMAMAHIAEDLPI
jgi:hypothetical protein